MQIITFFLSIDQQLLSAITTYGPWIYGILFVIVFCETGLVVTPFLPGDSLLFAAGTFAAMGDLNLGFLWLLLSVAAIAGDTVNYTSGKLIGEKIFSGRFPFLKPEHLKKTHEFFDRYGAKTIVLARFVPIVRTFAPFVAGAGTMNYAVFIMYNVVGGLVWVSLFLGAGYFFGTIPVVQNNFELVIIAIIFFSILPMVYEWWKARRKV
ncbi:MAG: DedA family protein [Candidatus Peregrinibacteria bacterium]